MNSFIPLNNAGEVVMTGKERQEKLKFQSKGAKIEWDIYNILTTHRFLKT